VTTPEINDQIHELTSNKENRENWYITYLLHHTKYNVK
jgi:hypothetical protein